MATDEDAVRGRALKLINDYQTLMGPDTWDRWIDLWADDGVLEFPFAPKGRQSVYEGKAEILPYMQAALGRMAVDETTAFQLTLARDPNVVVVEASIRGRAVNTGNPLNQRYIIVFELKDGKLWRLREYWNPLVSIEGFGPDWTKTFGQAAKSPGQ